MPRVGKNVNDGMLPSTLFVLTVRYRRLFVSDAATTPLGHAQVSRCIDASMHRYALTDMCMIFFLLHLTHSMLVSKLFLKVYQISKESEAQRGSVEN